MDETLDWLGKNKYIVMGGAFILFGIVTNMGQLQQNAQNAQALKQERSSLAQQDAQLEITRQTMQARAKIADARYEAGCILVVASSDPTQAVSIVAGQPVTDRTTGRPIPPNSVVCDVNGNTGVINTDLVVDDVAFTGDTQMIAKRIQQQGFDANINDPAQ